VALSHGFGFLGEPVCANYLDAITVAASNGNTVVTDTDVLMLRTHRWLYRFNGRMRDRMFITGIAA
jgi:hypothetical protein